MVLESIVAIHAKKGPGFPAGFHLLGGGGGGVEGLGGGGVA